MTRTQIIKRYNKLVEEIENMDDKRPGCVSAIFVENAKSSNDIREAIMNDAELRWRFSKRLPKENEI